MIYSFLLFIAFISGLFVIKGFEVRDIFLLLAIFSGCFLIFARKNLNLDKNILIFSLVMLLIVSSHMLFHDFNSRLLTYTLIIFIGFSIFIFTYILIFYFPLNAFIKYFTYALLFFAYINIGFVILTDTPWLYISLFTGTDIYSLSHLHNRILMPFGTPQQLGFCSLLLLNYYLYKIFILNIKSTKESLFIILLFLVLLNTYSISVFICMGIILIPYIFKLLSKRPTLVFIVISSLSIVLISFSFFSVDLVARDGENIAASLGRHILLRLETIENIKSFDLIDILFGVGNGQSYKYIGGTYSFTVLLSVFHEMGIFGFLLFCYYFLVILRLSSNNYFSINNILILFVFSMFYQINTDITFYVLPLITVYGMRELKNISWHEIQYANTKIAPTVSSKKYSTN